MLTVHSWDIQHFPLDSLCCSQFCNCLHLFCFDYVILSLIYLSVCLYLSVHPSVSSLSLFYCDTLCEVIITIMIIIVEVVDFPVVELVILAAGVFLADLMVTVVAAVPVNQCIQN